MTSQNSATSLFEEASSALSLTGTIVLRGNVTDVRGIITEATGPFVPVGSEVKIHTGQRTYSAQVVGFKSDRVLLMPYDDPQGISSGAVVEASEDKSLTLVSDNLLGKVIDCFGEPIDGSKLRKVGSSVPLYRDPPNPVSRNRIDKVFDIGVRLINSTLTVGCGQRLAIMAGSGVGKSTLLGMVAKHSQSQINVIALVGERGREVREFIERDLGPEGLARSIVVVATGNESALRRIRAAHLATAIAEHFRDAGKQVVLMVDSVTRLAMAQREIGLAVGEPPSTRGYTPSVFAMLPRLLERAGTCAGPGTITGLYTVLVEGDDMNEPVADTVRGILDGHIVLDRKLAGRGQYPAVDVLQSVSRVMADIVPPEVIAQASSLRDIISTYRDNEDLLSIGAYKPGSNARLDKAVNLYDSVLTYLRQKPTEKVTVQQSWQALDALLKPKPA